MAGEIIRLGDRTSHDGTVLEGSQTDICLGKPIAYIGHKVHCPKCKGDYPIVEGVPTTTFFGKGVALAGMKTSCGAVLIASQFTDTVEWGGGGTSGAAKATAKPSDPPSEKAASGIAPLAAPLGGGQSSPPLAADNGKNESLYDEQFLLKDGDDVILADMPYTVKLPSGELIHGISDTEGRTGRYRTGDAQYIEICLGHIET
ncbi:PAAR domain-containing protein [Duganella sp. Root1480D1]|uniref:PAAR domain-containing protein n=1 Tax=Duganella sp. Root1480D1 TaxID=1736471 RepID=UPI0009EA5BD6|nr:PAAR domain-containing protein [Duganella sp. Root1480D1]